MPPDPAGSHGPAPRRGNAGETPRSGAPTRPARDWGPDVLLDQQIGGGVMWVPGTMMLAIAVLVTTYFWADHEGFRGRR